MDETSRKPILILHTNDLDYALYHEDERFAHVRAFVREKRYTASKTDVTYRVLSHWDAQGLLPAGMKESDGAWRRFNFIERVWLEAIKRLRAFGLSLETIARVQKQVMRWHEKSQFYPEFEYFTAKAWFSSADPYILVLANGDADVGVSGDIELGKILRGNKDMLLISLKSILKDMGIKRIAHADTLHSLTKEEIELLVKIRIENNSEVRVKTDEEGRITELESTKTITDPPPNYELQKQLKDKGMYGEVVTKYEDGKSRSVRITKKQRFDAKK